jgi:hypothetical protein
MIKNWLETTNDDYMIMMEDDYDLSLIEYWHFDWDYLMNRIPYDWDCIQLGFESLKLFPFFLHPKMRHTYFGPCMINRDYAKKLVKLHCVEDKFKLNIRFNDVKSKKVYGMVDGFILEDGKTYSIPLITNNPDFGSDYSLDHTPREWFKQCKDLYYLWWKTERDNFTLEDFFTYGKPYDYMMVKKLNYKKLIQYS